MPFTNVESLASETTIPAGSRKTFSSRQPFSRLASRQRYWRQVKRNAWGSLSRFITIRLPTTTNVAKWKNVFAFYVRGVFDTVTLLQIRLTLIASRSSLSHRLPIIFEQKAYRPRSIGFFCLYTLDATWPIWSHCVLTFVLIDSHKRGLPCRNRFRILFFRCYAIRSATPIQTRCVIPSWRIWKQLARQHGRVVRSLGTSRFLRRSL